MLLRAKVIEVLLTDLSRRPRSRLRMRHSVSCATKGSMSKGPLEWKQSEGESHSSHDPVKLTRCLYLDFHLRSAGGQQLQRYGLLIDISITAAAIPSSVFKIW